MDHFYQISTVVDDDVRLVLQAHFDVLHVLFVGGTVIGEYGKSIVRQGCRHIVLRGKAVAARYGHLCAACRQHQTKVRRLGFQMNGKTDPQSFKRFRFTEFILQTG